tara:strand:+ start:157 stop:420 length:264 start_codon:yes stop_codon:yes gene_type:complete
MTKKLFTPKGLTSKQNESVVEDFVELVVDGMDIKTLVQIVTDQLTDYYDDLSDVELKEEIDNYNDDGLYDELVDNATSLYPDEEVSQ